jgi:carboxyl-terminal processing protease
MSSRTASIAALAAVLLPHLLQAQDAPLRPRTVAEDLQMFSQVLNQIRVNHPDSVEMHGLFMAAIEGMVASVDPHSYVLPARRLSPEKEQALRDGRLYPVPIAFTYIGGAPVVVSIARASAAAALDILPGDELIAIDGAPLSARSSEELRIVLAGPRNSTVSLTLERQRLDGSVVQLTRSVMRERPEETTAVPTAFMLDDRTGYIRITHFLDDRAARRLRSALQDLESRGMGRLVLDLRDNGGGLLDEAARVAGEFLPKGTIVYRSEGRHAETTKTVSVPRSLFRSDGRRYPLVVLVNRGTASAAELLAGALQDHERAVIVGRPTFGKALLMRGFPLADGSLIVLVIGHLQTPCGRVVQRAYRDVTSREYYRMARAERDTAGLPSCRTQSGRVLHGGDGIRPDVLLPEWRPPPLWVAQLNEADLPLRWVGPFLERTASPATLEEFALQPALPDGALADFRAFAARQTVELPDDAAAADQLGGILLGTIARARWGNEGYYRLAAVLDPDVAAAAAAFERVGAPGLGKTGTVSKGERTNDPAGAARRLGRQGRTR